MVDREGTKQVGSGDVGIEKKGLLMMALGGM